MLLGVPQEVNQFFAPLRDQLSKPIRGALAPMVLAFLLSPHYRRLKTIAGMVLGHRVHVGTISRRLANPLWKTRDWYEQLAHHTLGAISKYEKPLVKQRKRRFIVILDATLHQSVGRVMSNLVTLSKREDERRKTTRHHIFVMGILMTDTGMRVPLPRKSYYSKSYCQRHNKRYRTQNDLACLMIAEAPVPQDAEVIVLYDSAFDCDKVHRACKKQGFYEVFPIEAGRVEAKENSQHSLRADCKPVVAGTLDWDEKEFTTIELDQENEGFAEFRRRHVDNLRAKKTYRKYVAAGRHLSVSKLGACLVVASFKENPKIELLAGQSDRWQDHRAEQVARRKHKGDKKKPSRWYGKVLACTVPWASVREAIELYEVRWQIELFFRELKSRLQFGCYVLMNFKSVERYVDMLMMGFLYLERLRLDELRRQRSRPIKGKPSNHWRVTDALRTLEAMMMQFNCLYIRDRIKSKRGQAELMAKLQQCAGQVA